ncbi:hypothetical protein V8F20_005616 [Naviculisporaceae sp. PSN 640]
MLIHRPDHHHDTARLDVPVGAEMDSKTPQAHSRWQKRLETIVRRVATPLNSLATGRGCESFVPISVEDECAKAARILRSFSYSHTPGAGTSTSHILTIPPSSISSAAGVLIFTTGRLGLSRLSASTGSGILITRRDNTDEHGTRWSNSQWNYPLAIQTHGVGLGPLAMGFDISDRVYLIRSQEILDKMLKEGQFIVGPEVVLAFGKWGGGAGLTFSGSFNDVKDGANKAREEIVTRTRGMGWGGRSRSAARSQYQPQAQTHKNMDENEQRAQPATGKLAGNEKSPLLVGTDHSAEPLPVGQGGQTPNFSSNSASHPPIHCYMRSHGLYAGLQAEGTVFSERSDTTAQFYSRAGAFGDEQSWKDCPEGRAVEGVFEALRELEFGSRDLRA